MSKFSWAKDKKGKRTGLKIWKRKGKRHKLDCANFPVNKPCWCDGIKNLIELDKKVTRLLK